jgi:hypothetical protein
MVNIVIFTLILVFAFIDFFSKKNLKSQIISLGVLGTFIGIYMGLQNFNPDDMKNGINGILVGLKTAFFTSIVGMGTALFLSTKEKIFSKTLKTSSIQESLLFEISQKLDNLDKLNSREDTHSIVRELVQLRTIQTDRQNETAKIYTSINEIKDNSNNKEVLFKISKKLDNLDKLNSKEDTDKIISELERLRAVQINTRDETANIYISIDELRENSNKENQKLIEILDVNFEKMNNSLEIAIDKLSKGATEEIIKALEHVIKEFNHELQSSFGDNFTKLNEAVVNLLEWQNNYKTHIEHIEEHLNISTSSIEKSKESLEIISSKNEAILLVYKQLKNIIHIYHHQIKELNQHLETYSHLSDNAENMFFTITKNISKTTEEFEKLRDVISSSNQEQKKSFLSNNEEVMESYSILTQHIKDENTNQAESHKELLNQNNQEFSNLAQSISSSNQEQKKSFLSNNEKIMESYSILTQHIKDENTNQAESHKELLNQNNQEIKKAHLDLTKNIKFENEKQIKFNKELFSKNKEELENISKHFNNLGEEIPKALQISLNELNRGLTSLTKEFQKNYKEIMDKYKSGINNE